jgi:kanamycin kinase
LAVTLWSLMVLVLGSWCGLRVTAVSFGVGPALRTWLGAGQAVVVRRIPYPVLVVQPVVGSGPVRRWRMAAGVLAVLVVQALAGWVLLLVPSPFGVSAGLACWGVSLVRFGSLLRLVTVGKAARVASTRGVGESAAREVFSVVQRSVPQARSLIEQWPAADRDSTNGRLAQQIALAAEGRYREATALSQQLAQVPDLMATERFSVDQNHARALAYSMEVAQPESADRERFLDLHRRLGDAPAQLTSGSDLQALYRLAMGELGPAIDEARAAARVGSAPLRRSLAYCTLALALKQAGQLAEARKALASARETGPDTARADFVAGVLG